MSAFTSPFPPPMPSTSSARLDPDLSHPPSTASLIHPRGTRRSPPLEDADSDGERAERWNSLFFNGQSPMPRGLGAMGPTLASGATGRERGAAGGGGRDRAGTSERAQGLNGLGLTRAKQESVDSQSGELDAVVGE